jgi:hypothetical protein
MDLGPSYDVEHPTLVQSLMKFCTDRDFIYITTRAYESKEEIQSYYNLTKEDLEEITKDWTTKLLIPTDPA